MKIINVSGFNIRYINIRKLNPKGTIVLLHGIGASAERWSNFWPLIKDYNVVIPDLIGFGYSDKPLVEYSIDFFIDFLNKFFKEIGIKNPILIASSFGGLLAMEFVLKFKENIKKLILISPAGTQERPTFEFSQYIFAGLYPIEENVHNAFKLMSNSYDDHIDTNLIKDFINRMKLPNAKYALISTLLALRNDRSIKNRLKDINLPTLIIWGRNDKTIPVENLEHFKVIPKSESIIIENCGHNPHVEKPVESYQIVKNFI